MSGSWIERVLPVVEALVEKARGIVLGPPMDRATKMGALVSREHIARVEQYLEIGKREGRLFYRNGYQDSTGTYVLVGAEAEYPPFKRLASVGRPPSPGCTKANPDPLLVARGLQDAMFCGDGWMMRELREGAGGGIVAESPVWSRGKSEAYPRYGVVQFVFRTRYSPQTQAWTALELDDTGEIYEIGKTRSGHPGGDRIEEIGRAHV